MRVKDVFSVFSRKPVSGKVVFYYQCYDDNGNHSSGLSTGQIAKTAARAYCMRLYREGNLFPNKHSYIRGIRRPWWDWDTCDYLRNQKGRKDITQAYADNCRKMVKNQILPYFGKTRLDRITSEDINNWLLGFKERKVINAKGKEEVKSYKNTTPTWCSGHYGLCSTRR
jgi:hypothetical protein